MRWLEWSKLPAPAQLILEHTFNCALADGSFLFLFWLIHLGVGSGWLLAIVDVTEDVVLVVVTLFFASVLIYDLMQERVRAVFRFFTRSSRQSIFA